VNVKYCGVSVYNPTQLSFAFIVAVTSHAVHDCGLAQVLVIVGFVLSKYITVPVFSVRVLHILYCTYMVCSQSDVLQPLLV
jgi:hypothetical protein